ncbi:hypothetical protein [Nocardiopsis lambiniae]|uniref:SWIM-type domain-containing protein n=1 Tax=Nocardiopsis lambiniae TaxID=3075539 RepID=A0ABU2MD03_9ACTN|nr:hypothetical protein [Nocardiopsis sp. DSM 44743]MDT0330146.1 hypothetical protein [Nocardiopsis sp. DSM 44743]
MSWSREVARRLGAGSGTVERWSVAPGEITARAGGHEVSLIRAVPTEEAWGRVCAALASQEVFRARVLAGELPVPVGEVCALLGVDLVPRGWDALVATCSCDRWDGVCAHLRAVAGVLGTEADRDPFTLTRWAGRDRLALRSQVMAEGAIKGPSTSEETVGDNVSEAKIEDGDDRFEHAPNSAAGFWSAPMPPGPPEIPSGAGDRVRTAAPGAVADELPPFGPLRT